MVMKKAQINKGEEVWILNFDIGLFAYSWGFGIGWPAYETGILNKKHSKSHILKGPKHEIIKHGVFWFKSDLSVRVSDLGTS
jgi:hypothetical protein